jgi:hypothetical protein
MMKALKIILGAIGHDAAAWQQASFIQLLRNEVEHCANTKN